MFKITIFFWKILHMGLLLILYHIFVSSKEIISSSYTIKRSNDWILIFTKPYHKYLNNEENTV